MIDRDVPQSTVVFGQPGIERNDPDFYAAFVLNYILGGGGFASRLTEEVREKRGLAYGVSTWLTTLDHADLWQGQVATQNARVGETLGLIREEWRRMAEEGPTEKELADAKTFLTGSFALAPQQHRLDRAVPGRHPGPGARHRLSEQAQRLYRGGDARGCAPRGQAPRRRQAQLRGDRQARRRGRDARGAPAELTRNAARPGVRPKARGRGSPGDDPAMSFEHDISRCFSETIGEAGIDRSAFEPVLAETADSLAELRQMREKSGLPLLELPRARDDLIQPAAVAERLRRSSDQVVLLGTGGSSLGGQTLAALAESPFGARPGRPKLHFLDNIDPATFEALLARLDLSRTGFLVVSKSGGTAETLMQFLTLLPEVQRRLAIGQVTARSRPRNA